MKFNTINRTAKAVVMSLAIGLGTVACSRDYTADYVYAVSNSNGDISAFAVDFQSGVLTQIPGSPFTTNMTNPSTLVAAPNGKTIYEIGGSQNANVGVYQIGYDGKLYGAATPNITGTYPTAAAIDAAGKFLYVTYTYQSGYSPVSLGPGGVSIFPINADGTLGTPTNVNVGNNPVAIAVSQPVCDYTNSAAAGSTSNAACVVYGSGSSSNNGVESVFVYVVDAETPTTTPTVLAFAQNMSTGALTQVPGTNVHNGYNAGVAPSSIVVDVTGKFAYITDKQQNEIFGYQIQNSVTGASGTDGSLSALVSSPFATGQYPVNITIDPRDKYVYVANYNSNTVSSYSLNLSNGSLGASAGSGFTTQTAPTCVTIDPSLGIYLYTSNYLGASISGGNLSPDTGQLTSVPNVFFPTIPQPACLVAVPNGAHSIQIVNQ
ncbi:MAG: lactonase family protein [Acidobacteria bacterium]|nr:lactonase family protein [Acidobacteriota bacterium]